VDDYSQRKKTKAMFLKERKGRKNNVVIVTHIYK